MARAGYSVNLASGTGTRTLSTGLDQLGTYKVYVKSDSGSVTVSYRVAGSHNWIEAATYTEASPSALEFLGVAEAFQFVPAGGETYEAIIAFAA